MLILSQDKSKIVNLENLEQIRIEFIEKYPIYESDNNTLEQRKYCIYCNNDIFIGTYISEKRAKEVLQEIIKAYIENKKGQETNSIFGYSIIPSNTYYEMPEK